MVENSPIARDESGDGTRTDGRTINWNPFVSWPTEPSDRRLRFGLGFESDDIF